MLRNKYRKLLTLVLFENIINELIRKRMLLRMRFCVYTGVRIKFASRLTDTSARRVVEKAIPLLDCIDMKGNYKIWKH